MTGESERLPYRNVVQMFEATVARIPNGVATRQKRNGVWTDTSWAEIGRRARALSDGLAALGARPGDRISVVGESTTEWALADLGITGAGCITVPIYQSNRPHEIQYILDNSGARWIFCDTEQQVAKVREVKATLPELQGVIRFTGTAKEPWERTLADVEALGVEWRKKGNEEAHVTRVAAMGPDVPCCFIYTSGTTGNPKGVVLTHRNMMYEAWAIEQLKMVEPDDIALFFLPMAHVFAKMLGAVWIKLGTTTAFVESIDKIVENAGEVHPTSMSAVPRIFEKAYNAVVAMGQASPDLKGKLFRMAMAGLDKYVDAQEQGKSGGGFGLLIGKKVVFPKIGEALKARFGGRIRFFSSGGAPLSPKINWFFRFCGIEICEGYGLTETSAATFTNSPGKNRIGTVGPPVPGTEVRIAPDGEILVRGPGVMKEYYRNPTATAEALRDGWLYTGDIGMLDEAGFLKITDRKKDIIVTAGGKNVAPQNLENELKGDPFISQVMVHGDKRKFLSALVTVNEENVRQWAKERSANLSTNLADDDQVRQHIQRAIDALNAKQPSYSTIKKWAVLPKDFTQENGELTPTLKVKRKVISDKYRGLLDSFYAE